MCKNLQKTLSKSSSEKIGYENSRNYNDLSIWSVRHFEILATQKNIYSKHQSFALTFMDLEKFRIYYQTIYWFHKGFLIPTPTLNDTAGQF